ncbi:RsmE family RNA methyltransferase [Tautonia sociabilis]|uniref:Ribosomal RNA small subunit methyltransferase E n=1 Tax=Tautonia sociabilis TaxID=2080755 RepID=A0A432MRJ3_9BACT|nr:RsmE family RNA methyltransferase [Tautonia sociabilis]RUL89538.1 16S rRNA (uracil(1498)-N(3))-methyltransferase [Tautonia sociabilis]
MERVYVPDPIVGPMVEVSGPEAHHLARVRRSVPGDRVELFDGRGNAVQGRIEAVGRSTVSVVIEAPLPTRPVPSATVTLASAVPKGERFDWLIEKATELGVARLIPIRTARSVVDPRSSKLDRLRRLVVEASKQSGRNRLMELGAPIDWEDLIGQGPLGVGLVAHPAGEPIGRVGPAREVTVAIGPEGGFTDEEIGRALASGWRAVGLGPTILRIETAGLAACAAILSRSEGEVP